MRVVALAGGTGAAKFLRGLSQVIDPADLTIVGNTGDDLELWGLYVSPDLDTVSYTLAGIVDESKGWGVRGDSFETRARMAELGEPTYFGLGDKDIAVHLFRTERLRAGDPLSKVTETLRKRMGIASRIVPMSDDRIATRVKTPAGWLSFQEFFVRERCEPDILDLAYEGSDKARPAPGLLDTLHQADAIVICPSNPISSVGPILAVPGIRAAIAGTRAQVSAVSPIVGDAPVSGPAGKMMRAKGFEVSALGVADAYTGLLDQLVIDERDAHLATALGARGTRAIVTSSIMGSREREIALARRVMETLA
jgi:LPPG:FO 2-phospho-L-lactate transferase